MDTVVKKYIKCPHCSAQYVAAQIFYPSTILSKPKNVIRDPLGKIIFVQYIDQPEYKDSYICDFCNKEFIAIADVNYKAIKQESELDFTTKVVSLLD